MKNTTWAPSALVMIFAAGSTHAGELDTEKRYLQMLADLSYSGETIQGGDPNACGAAPLPLSPTGPATTAVWQWGNDDPVDVTTWRIPCSAAESMVVLTLRPRPGTNPSFICAGSLTLLQAGGLQTEALNFRNDPPTISSFCGDVIAPVTVALFPRSNTPAAFDFDQGFSIVHDGVSASQTSIVVAYDPAAYGQIPPNGTNAVEVRVRGAGSHFSNCIVTTVGSGPTMRYNASCAHETPTTFRAFERFDY